MEILEPGSGSSSHLILHLPNNVLDASLGRTLRLDKCLPKCFNTLTIHFCIVIPVITITLVVAIKVASQFDFL